MLQKRTYVLNTTDEPQTLQHPDFRTAPRVGSTGGVLEADTRGRVSVPAGVAVEVPQVVWYQSARRQDWARDISHEQYEQMTQEALRARALGSIPDLSADDLEAVEKHVLANITPERARELRPDLFPEAEAPAKVSAKDKGKG